MKRTALFIALSASFSLQAATQCFEARIDFSEIGDLYVARYDGEAKVRFEVDIPKDLPLVNVESGKSYHGDPDMPEDPTQFTCYTGYEFAPVETKLMIKTPEVVSLQRVASFAPAAAASRAANVDEVCTPFFVTKVRPEMKGLYHAGMKLDLGGKNSGRELIIHPIVLNSTGNLMPLFDGKFTLQDMLLTTGNSVQWFVKPKNDNSFDALASNSVPFVEVACE